VTVSVSVSPAQVNKGQNATFTIYINPGGKTCQPITVHYAMHGTAQQGTDYTLSGAPGKVVIQPSQQSATVTLHAKNNSRTTTVKAIMALEKPASNAGFQLSPPTSATVTLKP
jgi:hypothetical protein